MIRFYHLVTENFGWLLPFWLRARARHGKEDLSRLPERFGHASQPRPSGPLLWVHAASVGESQTVGPLLERLLGAYPTLNILITTGTVTSAQLLARKQPPRVLHQYVPLDIPVAVDRFLTHWQPDLVLWVESEFWPNLLQATQQDCPIILLNGRVSARSAARWQRFPQSSRLLMQCFSLWLAASAADAERLQAMGAQEVVTTGNLKFSAPPLACDMAQLEQLQVMIGDRPVWLAASTHAGEEAMIAQAHCRIREHYPDLLTIIVPRHAARGSAIATELQQTGLTVARRSLNEVISDKTAIYIADTMGELGIFYRAAPISFIGGSLVSHGGQNPFEAARLGSAVVYGPFMRNFTDFCQLLEASQAAVPIQDVLQLAQQVIRLLSHPEARQAQSAAATAALAKQANVIARVWDAIRPLCNAHLSAIQRERPALPETIIPSEDAEHARP